MNPPNTIDKETPLFITVSKFAGKAIMEFDMIEDQDKIVVAVSGGKDSLSLLHILRHRQKVAPIQFDVCAVHVDFELSDFDPQPLVEYFKAHGFSYRVEKVASLKGQKYDEIDCFSWSRARRKALFELANKQGFTKIAFGHHMDDIAETIVLNQFYRGEIGAMKPKQELFDGKIVLIRPLAYVREDWMRDLAVELKIDSMGQSKCSFDDTSHRMKIKKMLREFENDNTPVVKNIFNSLSKVREDYLIDRKDK